MSKYNIGSKHLIFCLKKLEKVKNSLHRLQIQNTLNQQVQQINDRKNIERDIIQYNQQHFRQAYASKA